MNNLFNAMSLGGTNRTRKPLYIPFHPLFFSTYPILALYIRNLFLVSFSEFFLILIVNSMLMVILWLGINKLTKDIKKSALIVSSFFILFFSFGHFLPALTNLLVYYFDLNIKFKVLNHVSVWNWFLMSIWLLLFVVLVYLTFKSKSEFLLVTGLMNIISLTVIVFSTVQAAQSTLRFLNLVSDANRINNFTMELLSKEAINENSINQNNLPDIYYIILDGYANFEILEKYYHYDNHEIKEYLNENDFYIAEESHSNYAYTILSLASSLNFDHLDEIINIVGKTSSNPIPLVKSIKSNRLSKHLSDLGYQTIAFQSGYGATDLSSSDRYSAPAVSITPYFNELINKTPLRMLLNESHYVVHRRRILEIFDSLPEVTNGDQPVFVFAHILCPHPPFTFGSNGEMNHPDIEFSLSDGKTLIDIIGRDDYQARYLNQVEFLNKKLKDTIERILSENDRQSIIILQGDHGPGTWNTVEERMSIINAYYFPDHNYENLYPAITPVNTFRIILDQYFGTNLGGKEDASYFSRYETPYIFIDVTEEIHSK